MALMQQTRVLWSGLPGGPGWTTFHTLVSDITQHNPETAVQEVADFFNQLSAFLPQPLSLSIDPNIVILRDTDGEAQQFLFVANPPEIETALTQQNYAAPSGAMIQWETGYVVRGRRLRGRTFVVPLTAQAYQNDGTLTPGALTALGNAADIIVSLTGAQFVTWSRPVRDEEGAITEEGLSRRISSYTIPDRVAILTSRRRAVR